MRRQRPGSGFPLLREIEVHGYRMDELYRLPVYQDGPVYPLPDRFLRGVYKFRRTIYRVGLTHSAVLSDHHG